jgi:hypothetical protein
MPKRANPSDPKEGIDWFKKRVPMKKKAWLKLDARAQAKAFTIARVAQLSMVSEVMNDLAASLKRGESFDQFKRRVSDKLTRAWGEERPWHVETIFRNGSQRAYSAGRRAQMTDPAVLRERPYWVLAPLLDSRTTDVCKALSPQVVLPAEHSYFESHWPPLHHNCRTVVYSVSAKQAKRMGVTKRPPRTPAAEGFGFSDPLEWQPDLTSHPRELVREYKRGK